MCGIEALKNTETQQIRSELAIQMTENETTQLNNPEEQWIEIKSSIHQVTKGILECKKRQAKKRWMTEEILSLMDERRRVKIDEQQYRGIDRRIKRKIKEAENDWLRR